MVFPHAPPSLPGEGSVPDRGRPETATRLEASRAERDWLDGRHTDSARRDSIPPDSIPKDSVPSCDDALTCTVDTSTDGGCLHTLTPGHCLIGGACVAAGASGPDTCHLCEPAFATRSWAPAPGCMITLAGNGANTVVDGPALQASLSQPSGMVIQPEGTVIACDRDGHTIRLIADGVVKIWAGCS